MTTSLNSLLGGMFSGYSGYSGVSGFSGSQAAKGTMDYLFSTTTTMADPTSGYMRYNTANGTTVTAIAISTTTTDSIDISTYLASFSAGDHFYVYTTPSSSTFDIYHVSSTVNNTSWYQLNVTYVAGSSAIPTNNQPISIYDSPAGTSGVSGYSGAAGGAPECGRRSQLCLRHNWHPRLKSRGPGWGPPRVVDA